MIGPRPKKETQMSRTLSAAALAAGLSLIATTALACGPDGCGKDEKGKPMCCCEKKHDGHATPGHEHGAPKPDKPKPDSPDHKDHAH